MKRLLLVVLLISFSSILFAQESLSYSKVINAEGLDKTSIYVAIRSWFASSYNNSKSVIEMEDKDAGIIMGKGNTKYNKGGLTYSAYEGWINYTIKVQARDGRYKVDISNIIHENKKGNAANCNLGLITSSEKQFTKGMSKKYHNNVVKDIQEKMRIYSESVFSSMEKATSNAEAAADAEEDW